MTPLTNKKKIVSASRELILEITKKVSIREQAIFTIIRQTGLSPEFIKKLKYKDLEQTEQIPRKIETRQFMAYHDKPPVFIGEEASLYLNRYLATRNNLTPESSLFCSKTGKEIDTKNLSRTFRQTLDKIINEKKTSGTHKRREVSIYSLVRFYQENSKNYKKALKDNPHESEDFNRRLYKEKAMPSLEFESLITIRYLTRKQRRTELSNLKFQNKEMKQTITRDREFISSILTLIYNNKGDPETGEAVEIGDEFIELWKETFDEEHEYLMWVWGKIGTRKLLPMPDIVEELTKTLKQIKEPYDQLQRETANSKDPFHSKDIKKV
jgi:hypothetical protein